MLKDQGASGLPLPAEFGGNARGVPVAEVFAVALALSVARKTVDSARGVVDARAARVHAGVIRRNQARPR